VAEAAHEPQSSDYFSANNVAASQQRDQIAFEVLDCMLDWLQQGGDVSIFDATNTTSARRHAVLNRCQSRSPDLRVIFLESICDDARVLEVNYRVKAMNSPDYKDMPLEQALVDLRARVANYEKVYQTIVDDSLSYIKLHNLASKVICNKIHGVHGHAIAAYLMSIHIKARPIFFVRAGHSESERGSEIEGQQFQDRQILKLPDSAAAPSTNGPAAPAAPAAAATPDFQIPYSVAMAANLDSAGRSFAKRLDQFMQHKVQEYAHSLAVAEASAHSPPIPNEQQQQTAGSAAASAPSSSSSSATSSAFSSPEQASLPASGSRASSVSFSSLSPPGLGDHLPLVVYTSTLPRSIQTASLLKDKAYTFEAQSALNMMDTGVCSGMNIDEIRRQMPEELSKWQKHKYRYRFPGGESQSDRARTLEPLVFELERQTMPVLVVSHMSTLQVLLGYFYGSKRSVDSYYSLWIPQHTVLEIIPSAYGYTSCSYDLSEEACREVEEEEAAGLQAESSGNHVAASPARSPRYSAPHVQQRDLGAQQADEVERFNLQVVPSAAAAAAAGSLTLPTPKTRAQAKAAELAGRPPMFGLGIAALAESVTPVSVPRTQMQDRSISIPVHNDIVSAVPSPHAAGSPAAAAAAFAGGSRSVQSSPLAGPSSAIGNVHLGSPGGLEGMVLPPAPQTSARKGSSGFAGSKPIGKASAVTVLGDTNFYEANHGS